MVKIEAIRVVGLEGGLIGLVRDGRTPVYPPVERAPERPVRQDLRGTASNVCPYAGHFVRNHQSQHDGIFSDATETYQRLHTYVSPIWLVLYGICYSSTEHRRFAEADLPYTPAQERGRGFSKRAEYGPMPTKYPTDTHSYRASRGDKSGMMTRYLPTSKAKGMGHIRA